MCISENQRSCRSRTFTKERQLFAFSDASGRRKASSNGLDAVVPVAQHKEWIPSSRNPATPHRGVAFKWFESAFQNSKKEKPSIWMADSMKPSNGLDAVVPVAQHKEWIPSSRNPATPHRGVAFKWFESVFQNSKKEKPSIWMAFLFWRPRTDSNRRPPA